MPPRSHLTCQEIVELVSDYLEGALPGEEATLFEEHMTFCDGCSFYLEQMRAVIATVGRVQEEDVPPEARDELLAAFRHWRRG
jgi:predicted anti-sigma-YlaC factor YlaD